MMRKNKLVYLVPIFALCLATGCGQQKHNREKREIEKERVLEQLRTTDLSEAVKATDEAGWDSAVAFRQFYDSANTQLIANKKKLSDFKQKISVNHKKIPLRYRARLRHLENRIAELETRLATYDHTGKAAWEDFTTLYCYDLEHLEKVIDKLYSQP